MKFKMPQKARPKACVVPCLLGLESVVGDELRALGIPKNKIKQTNGHVFWRIDTTGSDDVWGERFNRALYQANLGLSSAERVQIELAHKKCVTFEELYDFARSLPWEYYADEGVFFHLSGWSRKSKLYGIPSCQSLVKRAIMDRLIEVRNLPEGSKIAEDPEKGEARIQIVIQNDVVSLRLDTSGEGLHKRGYRLEQGEAPIKETLAAALIHLSLWPRRRGEGLYDPFCGSGTFVIEAARYAKGIAAGSLRNFRFESWNDNDSSLRQDYLQVPTPEISTGPILGSDIDPAALELAARNAERAGVADYIRFFQADITQDSFYAIPEMDEETPMLIIGNPPYGERLEDEIKPIHQALNEQLFDHLGLLPKRRLTIITAAESFEEDLGYIADKRRKLYNGMILSPMYHYFKAGHSKPYKKR